jgi:hypothetical protein
MGKVCEMKADRLSASETVKQIRVEPLFVRRQPRRSYLVFTSPRMRVVVEESGNDRFAKCDCTDILLCEHIQLVKTIDRERFPQNLGIEK